MDQLRAMRTFTAVAERGGFAAAARALDLAPSVVTRQVIDLERQLGARLLTRSTRRVALTAIGEDYLHRTRAILRDLDDAASSISRGVGALRGRVRLIAPPVFAARQLMPRLTRWRAAYPDVVLDLTASGPVDGVDEGHDISLVARADALDGDFVAHRLVTSPVLLCAAPGYLERHGRPAHPGELAGHALLLASLARTPRRVVMTHGTGGSVEVASGHAVLSSANAEVCRAGALAGMGITALPRFAVDEDLDDGRLEPVLGDWRLFDVVVHACLPSRRQVPAVVRAALDFLRAEFRGADAGGPTA